jgi:hypothetical protein
MVLYIKNHKKIRQDANRRYAEDESYRTRVREKAASYRRENAEEVRKKKAIARDAPGEREKAAKKSRAWHAENKERANMRRIERKQASRIARPWVVMFNAAKARCKKFGIVFELTHEWAEARWTGKCEVSQIPFELGLRGSGAKLFSPSIDQILPRKGYTPDNCRFVIWGVNALKHNGTDEQMLFIAKSVVENFTITI